MPTLYIREVPEKLYKKLSERAAREKRSLNAEAIVLLEEALGKHKPVKETVKSSIETLRSKYRLKPGKSLVELLREDRNR
ncbi:MAG: Arc family DNA-binding protein [Nitrospirae bacterium]|nr:Arc family DNA-binding protein [Nitrospirota bacterium]